MVLLYAVNQLCYVTPQCRFSLLRAKKQSIHYGRDFFTSSYKNHSCDKLITKYILTNTQIIR